MSCTDNKKDVKIQLYVTASMDDKIQMAADALGLTKLDVIRYFIAQGCLGLDESLKIIRENADKIIESAIK